MAVLNRKPEPARGGTPLSAWRQAAWQALALLVWSAAVALAVNALRLDRIALVGDFSPAARFTAPTGERIDIPLEEAEKLFFTRAAVFFDARPAEDYANGHIRGARSLPLQELDLRFLELTADLDLETPIVTYCDGETCTLSHELALFFRDAGFRNARVLVNGWTLWRQAGLPAETGPPER